MNRVSVGRTSSLFKMKIFSTVPGSNLVGEGEWVGQREAGEADARQSGRVDAPFADPAPHDGEEIGSADDVDGAQGFGVVLAREY